MYVLLLILVSTDYRSAQHLLSENSSNTNALYFPCREAVCSESEDNSNEALSGPSMQSQSSAKGPAEDTDGDDDDDDEEFIGPPLPPGFKDSDDDNDNDDTEEEDNVSSLFLFSILIL